MSNEITFFTRARVCCTPGIRTYKVPTRRRFSSDMDASLGGSDGCTRERVKALDEMG